jgi:hypothetical protein
VILVSVVLLCQSKKVHVLRTFLSIAILVAGAAIFAEDPSSFSKFSYCALSGTTIVSSALFLIGLALWLRE